MCKSFTIIIIKRTEENIDVALRMQMVGSSLVMIPVAMFISNAVLPRNFEIVKFIVEYYAIIFTIFNVYISFYYCMTLRSESQVT